MGIFLKMWCWRFVGRCSTVFRLGATVWLHMCCTGGRMLWHPHCLASFKDLAQKSLVRSHESHTNIEHHHLQENHLQYTVQPNIVDFPVFLQTMWFVQATNTNNGLWKTDCHSPAQAWPHLGRPWADVAGRGAMAGRGEVGKKPLPTNCSPCIAVGMTKLYL